MRLEKTFRFEAAHWLPAFPEGHKCRRMHGHSYRITVAVEGEVDETTGCVMDFGEIKAATETIRTALDHRLLNEIEGLENPTSEVLAAWCWERLKDALPLLVEVAVEETCTSRCVHRLR